MNNLEFWGQLSHKAFAELCYFQKLKKKGTSEPHKVTQSHTKVSPTGSSNNTMVEKVQKMKNHKEEQLNRSRILLGVDN